MACIEKAPGSMPAISSQRISSCKTEKKPYLRIWRAAPEQTMLNWVKCNYFKILDNQIFILLFETASDAQLYQNFTKRP